MNDDAQATKSYDRNGLEVLSTDECWDLLRATPIGRVAFLHEGTAVILPVTYGVVGHHIVFRTGRGAKFGAASMGRAASFEADAWDEETKTGWSVLVEGNASIVLDADEEAALNDTGVKQWAPNAGDSLWVKLVPDDLSGRRIPVAD